MTALLQVEGASVAYRHRRRDLLAVERVSLEVRAGETLGLIGESGSGKSTLAWAMLGLVPLRVGTIRWRGRRIDRLDRAGRSSFTQAVQMVFQDPHGALDPRRTVLQSVREPLDIARRGDRPTRTAKARDALLDVGLPEALHGRYPHQLSGGQKQRVNIARALVTRPQLLVCDESVSALDVALQAEILNLLRSLKEEHDLTIVFISHDLRVVGHLADRIAVMYLGELIEIAPTDVLFEQPLHPYTEALLSAQTTVPPDVPRQRIVLSGDLPSPLTSPSGCRFHPRCRHAHAPCGTSAPQLAAVGDERWSACLRVDELYPSLRTGPLTERIP